MGCRHHWLIEEANGPTSRGVCKFCGATHTFTNSVAEWGPQERKIAAHSMYSTPGEKLRVAEAYRE
jgi:hypothetical protein